MIHLRSLFVLILCFGAASAQGKKLSQAELDKATDEAMKKLNGLWLFEKGERNGGGWSLPEDCLYFERSHIGHTKKNGEIVFNGAYLQFSIDPTKDPMTIDMVRKNGSPGQKILGIYKIEGDRLYLATNTSAQDARPGKFSVKLTAGAERATDLQIYKLVKPDVPEKPPVKKKLSKDEIEAANVAALKELQGQWIFEKAERNGFSYWTLPEESIYIEKNMLRHAKKDGQLVFNGSACEITLDVTNPWTAITLVRKNGQVGQKIFGIYKIEGDRLTIATNTGGNMDLRPGQFTVKLTAGLERAAIVQTYKKAKE